MPEAERIERRLPEFVREHVPIVVEEWKREMRRLSPAQGLSDSALVDHLPRILDQIGAYLESASDGRLLPNIGELQGHHAIDRLARGFDLDEVINEYAILKAIILEQWEKDVGTEIKVAELKRLDRAFHEAITQTSKHYARARERLLVAIDKVAQAAFGTNDLDGFLARLLRSCLELNVAVNTAVVLLRDDDDGLRVRAAVGFEEGALRNARMRIGEGFAGTIAASKTPLLLPDAANDPLVKNVALKKAGVRVLYGVPLLHDGEVIGVAHIGSKSAPTFSDEDTLLFRLMAGRATSVILQAQLAARERDARQRLEAAHQHALKTAEEQQRIRERAERTAGELDVARRRAEETSALLDTLLARLPIGFAFLDPSLRYVRVNAALAAAHRVSAEGHIGKRPSDVLTDRAAAEAVESALTETLSTRVPIVGRELAYGTTYFLVSYYPIADPDGELLGVGKVAVDVTDQRRAAETQRFLADASKVLSSTLDFNETMRVVADLCVPRVSDWCGIDALTDDGALRSVALVHQDPSKIELARKLRALFPSSVETALRRALENGRAEVIAGIDRDVVAASAVSEEHRELLLALDARSLLIVPLVARGRSLGVMTFIRGGSRPPFTNADLEGAEDLASRAALAADNARAYQDAHRAADEASDAARAREQIVAVVSHDLKNPLNAMMLAAQIADGRVRKLPPESGLSRHIETIQRSARRMDNLIREVLTMSSLEAGRFAVDKKPCAVLALLDEAVALQSPIADEKHLTISCDDVPADLAVAVDHERMLQVFSNLLSNALKFTRAGGHIHVGAHARDNDVVFSVSDTGPGIKPDELPHIFEPFWSADRYQRRGTGLGLFIAKGIVEAHGGQLWVESQRGLGTTFFFSVKRVTDAPSHRAPESGTDLTR